jgi:hemin uptake protein HemP
VESSEDRRRDSRQHTEHVLNEADGLPVVARNAAPASYRTSDEIFKGLREVVINHNGAEYRLRITASDKLILTK